MNSDVAFHRDVLERCVTKLRHGRHISPGGQFISYIDLLKWHEGFFRRQFLVLEQKSSPNVICLFSD